MQIFIAYFGLSILGLDLPRFVAVCIPLILYTGAYMGEIVRAGVEAGPRGQWEAGRSLGMRYRQLMRYVVAPVAVRVMIPPSVGFLVQLVKGTSLAYVVGYVDRPGPATSSLSPPTPRCWCLRWWARSISASTIPYPSPPSGWRSA